MNTTPRPDGLKPEDLAWLARMSRGVGNPPPERRTTAADRVAWAIGAVGVVALVAFVCAGDPHGALVAVLIGAVAVIVWLTGRRYEQR